MYTESSANPYKNTSTKMYAITNDKKRNFVIEILNITCTRRSFIETKIIRMAYTKTNPTNSDPETINGDIKNTSGLIIMGKGTPVRKLTTSDTFTAFINFISKKSLSTILSTIQVRNKINI